MDRKNPDRGLTRMGKATGHNEITNTSLLKILFQMSSSYAPGIINSCKLKFFKYNQMKKSKFAELKWCLKPYDRNKI